jgi:excinuclease ABC subunit C
MGRTDENTLISTEPRPAFDGFGEWTLAPRLAWPTREVLLTGDRRDSRTQIRRAAPLAPGVYGMVDREGELVYVG